MSTQLQVARCSHKPVCASAQPNRARHTSSTFMRHSKIAMCRTTRAAALVSWWSRMGAATCSWKHLLGLCESKGKHVLSERCERSTRRTVATLWGWPHNCETFCQPCALIQFPKLCDHCRQPVRCFNVENVLTLKQWTNSDSLCTGFLSDVAAAQPFQGAYWVSGMCGPNPQNALSSIIRIYVHTSALLAISSQHSKSNRCTVFTSHRDSLYTRLVHSKHITVSIQQIGSQVSCAVL